MHSKLNKRLSSGALIKFSQAGKVLATMKVEHASRCEACLRFILIELHGESYDGGVFGGRHRMILEPDQTATLFAKDTEISITYEGDSQFAICAPDRVRIERGES